MRGPVPSLVYSSKSCGKSEPQESKERTSPLTGGDRTSDSGVSDVPFFFIKIFDYASKLFLARQRVESA